MECEDKIKRLEQTGSAASYSQTFQTLAAPLGLDKKSKCLMFFGGLKLEVKKAIIIAGRSTEFQELVNQAIKFDQLFYQQFRQTKRESQDDGLSYPNKRRQNYRNTNPKAPAPTPDSQAQTTPPVTPLPNTISRFRLPLTESEKEYRRRNNLCAYCGDSEHAVETCPQVKKKNSLAQNSASNSNKSLVSNVNNPKPQSPLLYPVPTRPLSAPPSSENWQSRPPRM
jgi:hypothetical protein